MQKRREVHRIDIKKLKSLYEKTKGLMLVKNPSPIFFETRFGVHTFFLKKPILVFVLSEEFVVKKIIDANPWRIYFWNPRFKNIVETPVKSELKKIKLGDKIQL